MIRKLKDKDQQVKMILVCGTLLAAVSMITGAELPDWVYKLLIMVGF